MNEALLAFPGFVDPVADAQKTFRAVLQALARPGTVHATATPPEPPPGLAPATAAVILALIDNAAPLHLTTPFAHLAPWIAFHTGSPGASLAEAPFVLAQTLPNLATLHPGSDEIPEASATVILQVPALAGGRGLTLRGPGIETTAVFAPLGLPSGFPSNWAANHRLFPRGIDLILCAGSQVAALPRSTLVSESA